MGFSTLSEEDIRKRLEEEADSICPPHAPLAHPFPPDLISPGGEAPRPAAVLVPFLKNADEWHLLFTRRTDQLADHSGQVAFPGGRMEAGDNSPEETALRESREEIGLEPEKVRILGRLDSFITITNYCVTPIVGIIPWPFQIQLDENEVSRVFTIPLTWLADHNNYEIRQRPLPAPYAPVKVIYFQKFEREVLWGVSAEIVLNLLRILRDKRGE
jgi:8-oxo-dGTP pyrophosphatase MutT (NUDIX family)